MSGGTKINALESINNVKLLFRMRCRHYRRDNFQTCPNCGHQKAKTLDERIHKCRGCGYEQDRDIASAEVCLYWVKGILPGFGTSLVDVDGSSSTSSPKTRKSCGGMKQLAQKKRRKSQPAVGDAETLTSV